MISLLVGRLQINYFWGFYYYQFDDLILNIYTTIKITTIQFNGVYAMKTK